MKDTLITFETAKLASEKGYSPILLGNAFKDKLPTQSLLQKWLREVHKIHFFILGTYQYYVGGGDLVEYYYNFNTYEEALEIGLQEALKLIK